MSGPEVWGLSSTRKIMKGCGTMNFPKNEIQTLLDWMREQMYGDVTTEWTYGNEHDRMREAADFLSSLLSQTDDDAEI